MKSLPIIATLSVLFLSGCAHTGYHSSYSSYGTDYGAGYGGTYYRDYPATVYYQQNIIPRPTYRPPPPRPPFGFKPNHRDWNGWHDHHDDLRDLERRQERQQQAIRRGVVRGDLGNVESRVLERENRRIERQIDDAQRRPWVSNIKREWIKNDLDRAGDRIRSFKNDDGGREGDGRGSRGDWGSGRRGWGSR